MNNFNVFEASNGLEALEISNQIKPDLIISDILMPEMDGWEFIEKFKKNKSNKNIPVIFLSALSENMNLRRGMNLGADDYLVKPFSTKDLLQSINLRINRYKQQVNDLGKVQQNLSKYIPKVLTSPLLSIIGFTDLILGDFKNLSEDEIKNYLGKIKSSGLQLQNILKKYILFTESYVLSQNETALENIELIGVKDVKDFVEKIVKSNFKSSDRLKDISFNIENCNVAIDAKYFGLIIQELIENAIKFSKPNTPIFISGRIVDFNFLLTIKDYGCGISEDKIENILNYEGFKNENSGYQDVGLGLIIVSNILKIFRGKIHIESQKNEYTSIILSLKIYNR